MRRLPASRCSTARTNCSASRGSSSSRTSPRATKAEVAGPYDVSLVEGSITTAHDAERIHEIREQSKLLVTIGACATSGGIQALRNFADVKEWIPLVYASPEFISTLGTSTPIADHVQVDLELRGCPISKEQLVETVLALLDGRPLRLPTTSVCFEWEGCGTACDAQGAPRASARTSGRLLACICLAYNRLAADPALGSTGEPEHAGTRRAVARARRLERHDPARAADVQRERAQFREASFREESTKHE